MENKIPECWHVRVTEENKDVLIKWSGKKLLNTTHIVGVCQDLNTGVSGIECNPKGEILKTGSFAYSFGKEQTFEWFKENILGEKPKNIVCGRDVILGQWYKHENKGVCSYIKPASCSVYRVYGEIIRRCEKYVVNDYWSNEDFIMGMQPLTALTEIQDLLPDGHPDKITPEVKEEGTLIGYKVKHEYRACLLALAFGMTWQFKVTEFKVGSEAEHEIVKSGILDVCFTPVYEEPIFHTLGTEYIKFLDGGAYLNDEDVTETIKTIFKQLK